MHRTPYERDSSPEPDIPWQGISGSLGVNLPYLPLRSVSKARRKTEDVGRLVSIAMVAPQALDHAECVGRPCE